jgi:hypothetical protein
LDVNGDCFQAIVDWLNLLAISSEDELPKPPSVDEEYMPILNHQLGIFTHSFELTSAGIAGCVGEVQRAVEYLENDPDMGNEGLKDNMLRLKSIFMRLEKYLLDGISKPRSGQQVSTNGAASHPGEFIFDLLKEGGGITHKNNVIFTKFVREVSEFIMDFEGNSSSPTPKIDHFVACIKKVFGTGTNMLSLARSMPYRVYVSAKSNNGGGFADDRTISCWYWCLSAETPILQPSRKRKRGESSNSVANKTSALSGEMGEAKRSIGRRCLRLTQKYFPSRRASKRRKIS